MPPSVETRRETWPHASRDTTRKRRPDAWALQSMAVRAGTLMLVPFVRLRNEGHAVRGDPVPGFRGVVVHLRPPSDV
jgi:hypothetical protein